MDASTRRQLSKALQSEARVVLDNLSPSERAALMEQRGAAPPRPVRDAEADRLVEMGLAVRTPTGIDLTMLGRAAARVAQEAAAYGAGLGVRRG